MRSKKVTRKSKSVYQTKALSKDRNSYGANYNSQLSYRDTAKQLTEFQPVSSKIQTTKFIKPLTQKQSDYINSIHRNVVTFALGSAACGKSMLALHEGCRFINSDTSPIDKIFYLRSNIGMSYEDNLGALPGELSQKVMQLAYPVLDNLIEFMSEGQAKYLVESGKIEVLPIGMIRGRSLADAFIVVDEIQNLSTHMLRTVLTRISHNSKMVLCGDERQIDFKDTSISGITEVVSKLEGCADIGIIKFTSIDIVRHPIISHILERL